MASPLKHCSSCSITSCRSYCQNNKLPNKYKLQHELPSRGMRCQRSGSTYCIDCLRLFLDKIASCGFPLDQLEEWPFYKTVADFLSNSQLDIGILGSADDSCICCQFAGKNTDLCIRVFDMFETDVIADLIIDETYDDGRDEEDASSETLFENVPAPPDTVGKSGNNIAVVSPSKPSTPKRPCKTRGASGRTRTSAKGQHRRAKQCVFKERVEASMVEFDGTWFDEAHGCLVKWAPGLLSCHVLGSIEGTKEEGILHGVITPRDAKLLGESVAFSEFNKLPKVTRVLRRERVSDEITKEDGSVFSYTNLVVTLDSAAWVGNHLNTGGTRNEKMSVQRRQYPSIDTMKKMTLFDGSNLDGCNILTILGEPADASCDSSCLFIGFDKTYDEFDYSNEQIYRSLKSRAGKNGIEASRHGGSNGYLDINDAETRLYVRRLVRTRGSIPRKANATLVLGINDKNRSGVMVMYISCESRKLKCCSWLYAPPRPGGQQKLTQKQLKAHPELYRFPDVRLSTAKILYRYNKRLGNITTEFDERPSLIRSVNRNAIYNMFYEATEAKVLASEGCKSVFMQHVLPQLGVASVHTLLEYPPGAHVDRFRGRDKDKIENKVIMAVKSKCNYRMDVSLGRGGAGRGIYAYAIIDHSESAERRREIRSRSTHFLRHFPHLARLRVTNQLMTDFFPGYNPQQPGDDPGPPGVPLN